MREQYNMRQLLSLGTVIALTPALRLFPARAAQLAGRAGWLAGLAALPLALGWAWAMARFVRLLIGSSLLPAKAELPLRHLFRNKLSYVS